MLKSTALIESYLDELIAKAVSINYQDILKEIKFTSAGFKAIEDKARKRWKDGGQKGAFSKFIIEEIKARYKKGISDEELLEDFKTHLSSTSSHGRLMHTERVLDDKREAEARAKDKYVRPEKSNYDEGLLQLFSDLINEGSFSSDEEVMRQWELFKDKVHREESDAKRLERLAGDKADAKRAKRKSKSDAKAQALKDKIKEALKVTPIEPKSEKLWTEYLKTAPSDITFKLVKLIGSPTQGRNLTSKRIKKFIDEILPKTSASIEEQREVQEKLNLIIEALDSEELDEARKRTEVASSRTKTALQAESEGNAIGKMSRTTKTGLVTIKWGRGRQSEIKLSKQQSNDLLIPKLRKFDIQDENWFNAGAGTLEPIVEAHLELVDSSLNKWKNIQKDEDKIETIKKLGRLRNTPKYIQPSNTLAVLYDRVWIRAEQNKNVDYEIPPIDFGFWVTGILAGLSGQEPRQGVGYIQNLIRLDKQILPSLINAIKEGIVVDPDEGTVSVVGIQRKYNRAMSRLKDERNRNEAIVSMFKIMNGENISEGYKGSDKNLIKDIEQSVRSQTSEKLHGHSLFYLLLEAHMEYSKKGKGRNILVSLLNKLQPKKEDEKVEFIQGVSPKKDEPKLQRKNKGGEGTTVYLDKRGKELTFEEPVLDTNNNEVLDEEGNVKMKPRIPDRSEYHEKEVRQPKKPDLVPKQERKWNKAGTEFEMVDVLDSDGKKVMVEPDKSLPPMKAGSKTKQWASKRRAKLRAETKTITDIDSQGREREKTVPKYTEEEIDELTGFTTSGARAKFETDKWGRKVRKSLEELLDYIGETDDVIYKEDTGLILESLNKTQKKKLKTILNVADPTEYFGHDFLKLAEVIKVLKSLGVVKGDKQLGKKVIKLEDKNLKVVKLATKLRKDYERLYDELRKLIFPKAGVDEK